MARPKKDNSHDTVQQILLGAEAIFARDGYSKTRLEDVAGFAGISRPSLLYHFKSKENLYEALVEHIFQDLGEVLLQGMSSHSLFEKQLEDVILTFCRFMEARPGIASILVREMVASEGPGLERLKELGAPLIQNVENWIESSGRVRSNVSIRSVMMHVISDTLLRRASPILGDVFWAGVGTDASLAMARALLVEEL